jgi:diacylglycerol O-acyltransferase / wax synthase
MAASRLSPFDRSFLDVETDASHMHVGWVARFRQPDAGPVGFEAISKHLVTRLGRAPRYRQRLARVPFELHDPVWVDDDRFDPAHHVRHAPGGDFAQIIGRVLSEPLARDRPLWEIHIADGLDDGSIGMVGKAHHCMVDGVAAVELVSLLLDQTPAPPPAEPDQWRPAALPAPAARLIEAAVDRTREGIAFGAAPRASPCRPGAGRRSRAPPSPSGGRSPARSCRPLRPACSTRSPRPCAA